MFTSLADVPYRFYIFSERLGNQEGKESEKILYAYPSSRSGDDQLKDVGLSEAFLRFYNTFAPLGHFRVLRSSDGRMGLYNPEPKVWMCITLRFPSVRPSTCDRAVSPAMFQSSYITDGIISTILTMFYQIWHVHHGTVTSVLNNSNATDCRYRLKYFFDRLLHEAQSFVWSLLDTFAGVSYLPLEKMSYLKIHSFVNRLECTFDQISASMVFYSNFLTWSGLNQEDTRTLYFYANRFLAGGDEDPGSESRAKSFSNGRFLQPVLSEGGEHHVVLKAYLSTYPDKRVCLLIYKLLSTMIFIVVPEEEEIDGEFVNNLSDFFAEHLLVLASDLAKASLPVYSSSSSSAKEEQNFKFIYYNTSNSALKSTIHDEKTKLVDRNVVPSDAIARMMLLADYLGPVEPIEVASSVSTDTWVVVKKTAQRQLFLVINRQRGTCTLVHVADELRRLSGSIFSDILFLEI